MDLSQNVKAVQQRIAAAALKAGRDPASVTLLAATKTQTSDTIRAAIDAGITVCGENRVQELTAHLEANAYAGAEVHFIGRLQTNKVRQVVGRVDLIESVDSPRLLEAIERQAAGLDLRQDILIEVNIGGEESKSGVAPEELEPLALLALSLPHVRFRGLMTVPPAGGGRQIFREMRQLFVDIKRKMPHNENDIDCLSMGMSGDYMDAIREGATQVRVGSALFGARPPQRPLG